MKKAFSAFTLVELMVVMAIISFLSVGAYAGITFALRQGRNTQRMRIADQLQTALTAYYADFQSYPKCTGATTTAPGIFQCLGYITVSTGNMQGPLLTGISPAGLKDYFDGDFSMGSIKTVDSIVYYYHASAATASPVKFTVCVDLEGARGGNTTKVAPATIAGNTDCYCVGADQTTVACKGVVNVP